MNAFAQVRHLLLNDVRRLRWMLGAYVACVAIAAAGAYSLPGAMTSGFQLPPLLVFLIGFLLVASAVQADSPCRPDAFWMSRPIQPFSVLGAKLVLAVLVVAVPVAGLAWSLIHLDFPSTEYWPVLGRAALTFSRWLLLGMAIAGVTRDLRSFSNTAILVFVLGAVAMALLYGRLGTIPAEPTAGASIHAVATCLAPLALLMLAYSRRDRVTLVRIVGATLLALLYLLQPVILAPGHAAESNAAAGAAGDVPHLSVSFVRVQSSAAAAQLVFRVSGAEWRNATRLIVSPDSLLVHTRDGATISIRNRMGSFVLDLPRTAPDGIRLRDFAPDWPVSIALSVGEVRALASGVSNLELAGRVEAYAINVARIMPFASGPGVKLNGTRLQLDSVQSDLYGASASVTSFELQHQAVNETALLHRVRMGRVSWALPSYQLIDDSTHQVIRLATPSSGTSDVSLVLPSVSLTRRWSHVQTPLDYTATNAGGQLRRVHFLYLDWEYVGSVRVRVRSPIE